ncbi:MAG: DUF493 domain-containing protein [Proteobacteria bacterium]|nr:MAG: DUF493 domain-containing protein [Pseudomonadota bacterium]QKK11334.1 MAG: DUF493 domain-containing protein [Pseudomonadota bacterium]
MPHPDTPLEFPCRFPIKAIGAAEDDFVGHVRTLVQRHVADLPADAVRSRDSTGSRFIAVTVTIDATSRAQLDAIYRELTASERVKFAL